MYPLPVKLQVRSNQYSAISVMFLLESVIKPLLFRALLRRSSFGNHVYAQRSSTPAPFTTLTSWCSHLHNRHIGTGIARLVNLTFLLEVARDI
ncbi:hypothetical protein BV25DRAFT_91480 [Artomyces pyxidatus]|uniref:Uncharacterized protein n=1 Tax=Artomyces pyxidatus TaxID=48021 RepID=A0ACB8TKU2_9AGAM|nr:hypothetical protein BV25DRAFT_91480 [Artomyces pyxidatus]